MPSKPAYEVGEDGKYHCTQPALDGQEGVCDYTAELPQHLGLHLLHQHGIEGRSRRPDGTPKTSGKRGRPPGSKNRPKALSADDICRTVLESVSPDGSIPIHAIPQYNEWVAVTGAFLTYLLD